MTQTTPTILPPAPRKRRWVRIVLLLALFLVVGLVLLVVLAPTLLSTRPGKNLALSVINGNLNGRAEIASWSLGWTSGVQVNDVKVFNKSADGERLVFSVGKISSTVSIIGLARGNFDIGKTEIISPNLVNFEIDENGVSNYQKLVKTSPNAPTTPERNGNGTADAKLPDLKGSFAITDLRGTISGRGIPKPVHIESSNVAVNIPDINQPITNDVKLAIRVGDGPVGTITLAGSIHAIVGNVVDVTKLTGRQAISILNIDLASATPFVQAGGLTLAGLVNGSVNLDAASMEDVALGGQFDVTSVAIGGAALKGDTYRTSKLSVPLDVRRSMVGGVPQVNVKSLKVVFDQGSVALSVDAPESVLLGAASLVPAAMNNALLGIAPPAPVTLTGASGGASISADVDLAAIAKQLPNTVALAQGVTLSSAHLKHLTTITFKPDAVALEGNTQLPDVAGTNAGRAIKLAPIQFTYKADAVGGASPDIKNIKGSFTSDFATLSGGGAALSQQEWKGHFDLTALRSQLDQFLDLDQMLGAKDAEGKLVMPQVKVELAGTGDFVLTTRGDLTKPGGTIGTGLQLSLANFVARNAFGLNTASPQSLVVRYQADLARGQQSALESIKNLLVEVGTGTLAQPTIALTTKGDATFTTTPGATKDAPATLALGSANLRIDAPDLTALSTLANNFMSGAVPVQVTRGSFGTTLSAGMSGQSVRLDVSELKLASISVKANTGNGQITLDKDVALVLSVALNRDTAGALQSIEVDKLSGDLGGLATLTMPKAIQISNLSAATPSATGTISLAGNIDRVCRFLEAVGGLPANSGYPYSGDFHLTQALTTSGNSITLAGDVGATSFRVLQNGKPIFSEDKLVVTNNVTVNPVRKVVRDLKLNVLMPSSNAMALNLTGERLDDWETKRHLTNFVMKLDYDLEKLWPIVKPMLSAEQQTSYADLQPIGKYSRTFTIAGAYPAAMTWQESLKSLVVDGGIGAAFELPSKGLSLSSFDRPFKLKDGILTTGSAETNPKVAILNGGALNTNNLTIDLTGPTPRLSTPGNKRLLRGVQVPPLMAQTFLAKSIPLFGGKSDAGSLDVTFAECNRLPLGALMTVPRDPVTGEENDGRAVIMLSAKNVKPGGDLVGQLLQIASFAGVGGMNGNSLQGEIPEGSKIVIDRGIVSQDITLSAGEKDRPLLHLVGDVNLQSLSFSNFNVGIPGQLISRLGGDLKKYAPATLNIPLGGSISAPKLATDQIIKKLVGDASKKFAAEQVLKLLGGQKDDKSQPPAQPGQPGQPGQPTNAAPGNAQPAPESDPLGGLFEVIQNLEKEKQEKKRQKEEQKKQEGK